mmetsp:Transcript_6896/g.7931  ORF Transcript_6896/g.7931 Transcript_6896/m.7931 type:complete len:235 (+) Transcript_6896:315-1019(+)
MRLLQQEPSVHPFEMTNCTDGPCPSEKLSYIFKNNREWISKALNRDPKYFEQLSKGQSPKILYIGCSDSRVAAEELMGCHPGEIFVHRNIANMVINADMSSMAVIEYAVEHLKVEHIVVCGHTCCGGVKAAMQPKDMGILNPWLRNIRDVYRLHQQELDLIKDGKKRYNRLVELNVEEQCINLFKIASVQKASREWGLEVHGWVFDVGSGKLNDLDIDAEENLDRIMKIYNLDD